MHPLIHHSEVMVRHTRWKNAQYISHAIAICPSACHNEVFLEEGRHADSCRICCLPSRQQFRLQALSWHSRM